MAVDDDFSEDLVYVLLGFTQKHRRSLLCTTNVVLDFTEKSVNVLETTEYYFLYYSSRL